MIIKLDTTGFKRRLWQRAYDNMLNRYKDVVAPMPEGDEKRVLNLKAAKQTAFYIIKNYGSWYDHSLNRDEEMWELDLNLMDIAVNALCFITPREFMGWFPIIKDYNGDKTGCKDYFSTMAYIDEIGIDTPIYNGAEFLWAYWNDDVNDFVCNQIDTINQLHRKETGSGLIESFFADRGIMLFDIEEDER